LIFGLLLVWSYSEADSKKGNRWKEVQYDQQSFWTRRGAAVQVFGAIGEGETIYPNMPIFFLHH